MRVAVRRVQPGPGTPARAVAYILFLHILAFTVLLAALRHDGHQLAAQHWARVGLLVALAAVNVEAGRWAEGGRIGRDRPHKALSGWTFAAALAQEAVSLGELPATCLSSLTGAALARLIGHRGGEPPEAEAGVRLPPAALDLSVRLRLAISCRRPAGEELVLAAHSRLSANASSSSSLQRRGGTHDPPHCESADRRYRRQ